MASHPLSTEDVSVVLVSCPVSRAEELATAVVEERLAACVNILPQATSVYRWQGQVETSTEALLLIKCTAAQYPRLEQRLSSLHPYELPEIITVPLSGGLDEYLDWVRDPDKTPPGTEHES